MNPPPSHEEVREDTLDLQPQIHAVAGLDRHPIPQQMKAKIIPGIFPRKRVPGGISRVPPPAPGASSSSRKDSICSHHLQPRLKGMNKAKKEMNKAIRDAMASAFEFVFADLKGGAAIQVDDIGGSSQAAIGGTTANLQTPSTVAAAMEVEDFGGSLQAVIADTRTNLQIAGASLSSEPKPKRSRIELA